MRDRRVFPHNLDAEASILGGILLRNDVLAQLDTLEVDDFYDMRHRIVFAAIRALEATATPIDVVTVENEIEKQGKLDAIGGVASLGELALRVPTADNVLAYAEIVRDKADARRLMLVASDIAERGFESGIDTSEYLDDSERRILAVTARRTRGEDAVPIGEFARRRMDELEQMVVARERGEVLRIGIPTGIAALDRVTGGWQFDIVNILAGRPAMGKTAALIACADAATAAGYGVHQFAPEDGWRAFVDRALARWSQIGADRLRRGDIDPAAGDVRSLAEALMRLRQRRNWMVDERAGLTAQEMIRSVRRHARANGTRVVLADYLQLFRRRRGIEQHEALGEILEEFWTAAKQDGICWVVGSQISRRVEERADKRPEEGDLKGSGKIEEVAKMIVALYRGAKYHERPVRHVDYECDCHAAQLRLCTHEPDDETFQGTVQAIVLKNNNGKTGRVFARWRGETTEIW